MLQIHCSGTPFEIGSKHGRKANEQVHRSIKFYAGLFKETGKLEWPEVQKIALEFEPVIREKWPAYLEEMEGVAEGAGTEVADIIALNVRTEINFGLFSDGCTALSWHTKDSSYLAQNWDWEEQQKQNLITLTIEQEDKPTIKMVTEAGILGKIGLNSMGVGVCLNAIRARGMDSSKLPCHLGLRMVLESSSREEAFVKLARYGIASACHMLIADPTGGVGVEWSYSDVQKLPMNAAGRVLHTNHYLAQHPGVHDTLWLDDSTFRLERIAELCEEMGDPPCLRSVQAMFTDEMNYPRSICRAEVGDQKSATLFNIVMDLRAKAAKVILGRPTSPEGFYELSF